MKKNELVDALKSLDKYFKKEEKRTNTILKWKKENEGKWIKVGQVHVDTGTLTIGDCFHQEDIQKAWDDLERDSIGPTMFQIGTGDAVVCSTGYGDGTYDVMAQISDGRVKEIKISFF